MQRIFIFIFFTTSFIATGQRSLQSINLNIHTGSANHIGDMATGDVNAMLQEARNSFGGEFSFYTGPKWGFGMEIDYGKLFADNANHKGIYTGILTRTSFFNSGMRITYNLLPFGKYWKRNSVTPYIFAMGGVIFSQSKYMTDIIYPTSCDFAPGTNISGIFGGGFGVKIRHNEHWTTNAEIYNYSVPGDRLEGFYLANDLSPDLLIGMKFGLSYSIYTW
ncbi:MAG: Uncharacterised protein [Owenweeksia sp. TMED14]|nr:MAG: Uncharacterised protein [Owenweeksia sp. TMED14]|tara:strand:- start:406 stop:1065 length:660 start_codon:yes stop_codon:yes gene_type:complete